MNSWLAVNTKIYERIVRGYLYERAERMFKGRLIQMQESIFSLLMPVMQVLSISFSFWLNETDICLYLNIRIESGISYQDVHQP